MGVTKIEWCDFTFNPWIGCTKVSDACDHCYAETLAKRYGWAKWGAGEPRKRTSEANWRKPLAWDRQASKDGVRRRVFCASLADVFDAEVTDAWRLDLMQLIHATPSLDWLLLTKRPQVAKKFFLSQAMPSNIWLGTTVEDQKMADLRIPILLSIPAKVRFLSCEPLLGPIDVSPYLGEAAVDSQRFRSGISDDIKNRERRPARGISWAICGGESGHGARSMDLAWAQSLRDQCAAASVPFFMKQLGGARDKRDRLEDFPPNLRVREFPS